MKLSKYIDHTILKPQATSEDIIRLCAEAKQYDFMSVCVNPANVALAKKELAGSDVKVCTVIGFPLGANTTATKVFETKDAINNGAEEIDMVINIAKAKEHNFLFVEEEIHAIKEACGKTLLKVILETCLLTDEEIKECSLASKRAGADYVKTSTGFSTGGATVHAVKLMRETVGNDLGVKASGGVHNKEEAEAMVKAGATRIGASAGVQIVKG